MLGPQLALLMCIVLIAYPFGSCVAYLIITGGLGLVGLFL